MVCPIGRPVYMVLQFIAFAAVLIGTPLDMFRALNIDIFGNTPCITLWGAKEKCYSAEYDLRASDLFAACNGRLKRWQAAEALALISIFLFLATFFLGLVRLLLNIDCLRWVCLVINLFCVVTVLAVVIIMIDAYNKEDSLCPPLHYEFRFGVGFALVWISWVVNLFSFGFLMMKR